MPFKKMIQSIKKIFRGFFPEQKTPNIAREFRVVDTTPSPREEPSPQHSLNNTLGFYLGFTPIPVTFLRPRFRSIALNVNTIQGVNIFIVRLIRWVEMIAKILNKRKVDRILVVG